MPANRVLKVRVRVTPRYIAEVGKNWREQFVGLLNEANRVLTPVLYARLELAGVEPWIPRVDEEKNLPALAIDLAFSDSGQDADWVVGLVGPGLLSGELDSEEDDALNHVGVGLPLSRYLALRALDDGLSVRQ